LKQVLRKLEEYLKSHNKLSQHEINELSKPSEDELLELAKVSFEEDHLEKKENPAHQAPENESEIVQK